MPNTTPSIFISYSRSDSDFADRLEADLRARGFETWVDRHKLEGGQEWAEVTQSAIERCDFMLVILSPEAVASQWVRRELGYAQDLGKRVIPLVYHEVSRIPIRLSGIQLIDFDSSYEQGLGALLFSIAVSEPKPSARPETQPTPITAPNRHSESELVAVPQDLPPTVPDLNELWRAATVARTEGNLELAEIYLQQIVKRNEDFGTGLASQQLNDIQAQLHPIRIQRLFNLAQTASAQGAWREAIGSWQALLVEEPDNRKAQLGLRGALRGRAEKAQREGDWEQEISVWQSLLQLEPEDTEARQQIPIAEQNQKWAWLYENAQRFVAEGQLEPAKDALETLWSPGRARFYGDPAGIAPVVGIHVPPTLSEVKAEQERLERERLERERLEREQREQRERLEREREQREQERLERERLERELERERLERERLERERLERRKKVAVGIGGGLCGVAVFAAVNAFTLRLFGIGFPLSLIWIVVAVAVAIIGSVLPFALQSLIEQQKVQAQQAGLEKLKRERLERERLEREQQEREREQREREQREREQREREQREQEERERKRLERAMTPQDLLDPALHDSDPFAQR